MTVDYFIGSVEIDHWVGAHDRCDACGEDSEIRVGDKSEWLLRLCAACAVRTGETIAALGRRIGRHGTSVEG